MTRINVVPVQTLKNDHLMAEYRELPRIFTAIIKKVQQGRSIEQITKNIPTTYVLGKGHVTFFYDKLDFLYERYHNLYNELLKRGFNLDESLYLAVVRNYNGHLRNVYPLNSKVCNDYIPDHNAIYLNMARLAKRSNIEEVTQELNNTK